MLLLTPLSPWLRASTLYTKAGMYTVQTCCLSLPSSHVSVQGLPQYNYDMSPVLFSTQACAHAHLVAPEDAQPPLEQLPACSLVTTKNKPSVDPAASSTPDEPMDTASDDV